MKDGFGSRKIFPIVKLTSKQSKAAETELPVLIVIGDIS